MPTSQQQIFDIFCTIINSVLLEHDFQKAISLMSENIIGIGMGSQGIIFSRADVQRLLSDSDSLPASENKNQIKSIRFEDVQCQCFDDRFATICAVVVITSTLPDKSVNSRLGQLMNLIKQNDQWIVTTMQATPLFDRMEELEAYPLSFAEKVLEAIHETKKSERKFKKLAELDNMTGLYRKTISEKLISDRLKTVSLDCPGAFFMIDLDYFKTVNDAYGHSEGDKVIRAVAACIQGQLREGDIAGRLGGDEFCIYFQGSPTIGTVSKKAAELCRSIKLIFGGGETSLSCSIGIAFCKNPTESFDDIYRKADKALYSRKNEGKDGYSIYIDK